MCYAEFKNQIVCWVDKEDVVHTNDSNQTHLLDMTISFILCQMYRVEESMRYKKWNFLKNEQKMPEQKTIHGTYH